MKRDKESHKCPEDILNIERGEYTDLHASPVQDKQNATGARALEKRPVHLVQLTLGMS